MVPEHAEVTMLLKGRVAIVTGAAQGIGREYARVLAANGAAVAVADINLGSARQTADEIVTSGGRPIALETDVSDKGSFRPAATKAGSELGAVTILVNNAAIYHSMRLDPLLEVDIGYWRKVFAVNLDGALLMSGGRAADYRAGLGANRKSGFDCCIQKCCSR